MIKVSHLNKYYNKGKNNEIHVINDVSMELPDTGLVTILGHSGSGKSTLLNVIGGLDSGKGEIQYDGFTMKDYKMSSMDQFRRENIGYVFQNYNLITQVTVYENLRLALDIIGITDDEECDKRIEYALKAVGMYKYRKKLAYALSGGQQQRIAIARALVKKCRILIADEPTGNLDSNNTIEVMNILKKVSKTALVLLVTHEQDIASYYSDYILRIEDGKLLSKEEHTSSGALSDESGNVVYLKDMHHEEGTTSLGSFNVYSDTEENKADFTLIIRNNTIYIRSDKPMKFIDEANLNIIDDHEENVKKAVREDDTEFDTSFYKDIKGKERRGFWQKLRDYFVSSYYSFKQKNKKLAGFKFALICIGIVFAIAVISLSNFVGYDEDSYYYNNTYYTTEVDYQNEDYINGYFSSPLKELLLDGTVSDVMNAKQKSYKLTQRLTVNEQYSSSFTLAFLPYEEKHVTLDEGSAPIHDNEVVISKNIADAILEDIPTLSEDELIGYKIEYSTGGYYDYYYRNKSANNYYSSQTAIEEFTIVGISRNDSNMGYITDHDFTIMDTYINLYSDCERYVEDEKGHYTITEGTDIDLTSDTVQALVSESSTYNVGNTVTSLQGNTFTVVGKYSYDQDITTSTFIVSQKPTMYGHTEYEYCSKDLYSIIEGKDISSDTEMIVPAISTLSVGDVDKDSGLTVVGRYVGSSYAYQAYGLVTRSMEAMNQNYSYYNCYFEVNDYSKAKSYLKDKEMNLYTTKDAIEHSVLSSKTQTAITYLIVFAVLFAITFIFIYLIMRSKMTNDIYQIGVYRSLGAKRRTILRKYLVDAFVLSHTTTIISYVIVNLLYLWFASVLESLLGSAVFMTSVLTMVLGGIVIVIISTLLGIIPSALLLKKTPAQILQKYDI